jgi:hypothetical protein
MLVVPVRRGVLVMPAEIAMDHPTWCDPLSASLRSTSRRGTLVVPEELEWSIIGYFADLTSRSLQADATIASLRERKSEGHACHARPSAMDYP